VYLATHAWLRRRSASEWTELLIEQRFFNLIVKFFSFCFSFILSFFHQNEQSSGLWHKREKSKGSRMEGDLRQKLLSKERRKEEEEEELSLGKRVWKESKLMWIVAAPAICTRFSTFGLNVISQSFVGHIGSRELAAFALVYTVLIRFANGVLVRFPFFIKPFQFFILC